jgi:hypothetical protein
MFYKAFSTFFVNINNIINIISSAFCFIGLRGLMDSNLDSSPFTLDNNRYTMIDVVMTSVIMQL